MYRVIAKKYLYGYSLGHSQRNWETSMITKRFEYGFTRIKSPFTNIGTTTLDTGKSWRPTYCLGSAESPAADFLLVWLKSSHSDPRRCVASLSCRPQVRRRLRLPCFYGRTLSRTVPAACTGPTCQNSRGNQNYRRPREFSPIPVKTPKSYLGS